MATPAVITVTRSVPIRHEVDVFVAGGGPAGVAATLAAARQGASVCLVEAQGCLGGAGTAGGLPMFCSFSDGVQFLADGVGRLVLERLREAGGVSPYTAVAEPPCEVIFRGEVLKRVYDDLLDESGASFTLVTQCIGVESSHGRVNCVICHGKSGLHAVRARVFVDATGDGDLCAWAGAPFEKGDAHGDLQPPTLCSVWAGIDWDAANAAEHGVWRQEEHLPRAIADGVFRVPDRHLPGMIPVVPGMGGGNIGHTFGVDGTDERSLTAGLVAGRRLLPQYARFYREYLTGYERMELVATGAMLAVRETRRILGDYVLGLADFESRAVFPDEIGRCAYPVDVHAARPGDAAFTEFRDTFTRRRYGPGESYGIPFRCLTPRGLDNVLVAGRCVSADRAVQGSLRVMPYCFVTGQAAGTAAALAAAAGVGVHDLNVREVQERLRALGACLPNC